MYRKFLKPCLCRQVNVMQVSDAPLSIRHRRRAVGVVDAVSGMCDSQAIATGASLIH